MRVAISLGDMPFISATLLVTTASIDVKRLQRLGPRNARIREMSIEAWRQRSDQALIATVVRTTAG